MGGGRQVAVGAMAEVVPRQGALKMKKLLLLGWAPRVGRRQRRRRRIASGSPLIESSTSEASR